MVWCDGALWGQVEPWLGCGCGVDKTELTGKQCSFLEGQQQETWPGGLGSCDLARNCQWLVYPAWLAHTDFLIALGHTGTA